MNQQALSERNEIVAELDTVIRDLEAAANEVDGQRGIGAESCISVLRQTAAEYRRLRNRLATIS